MSENKNRVKKNNKSPLGRLVMVIALLILVVVSLVSTTFSSFVPLSADTQEGSLIARIQSSIVNREKADVANVNAEKDVAETKATVTYTAGEYIYIKNFKPSGWGDPWITSSGYAWAHMWGGTAGENDYLFELYSGTKGAVGAIYRAKVATGGTYTNVIFTRNSSNKGPWTDKWNQTGDIVLSSSAYNCWTGFSADSTSKTGSHYAVPPSAVTASVTNAVSGSGTNADPYIVRPGASFTIELSATKADPGMEGFGWNINSDTVASSGTSNTYTASYTASTTEGTTTYTGYAWCYQSSTSNYSSSFKNSNTVYVKVEEEKYTYTVTNNYGGTVSPESGSVKAGTGVSITATPSTGYSFAEWTGLTKATLSSTTTATTTLTPTGNGATVKANFRPDTPSALTLTGSNVASGTSGTGTSANPYIVFDNGGFSLKATATVVTGASARYSTTSGGTYSTTNTFSPALTTKGTSVSYTVYAKAYTDGYYSLNSKSATAYYMVFSHLNGANTGFTMSSDNITDAETLTLSGAYVNGVADAEKAYITQTYQISENNSTFSDLNGSTWNPNSTGTYYFRVKTTNTKTGETVYSTSQTLTVVQSTVFYDITVVNDGTVDGTVTLKTGDTIITDGKILSNSPLSVSLTRPNSNYYIEYLEVDTITEFDNQNVNGNITDYVAYDHVKGNVEIHYKLTLKPTVTVAKPANADSITFKYYSDGTLKTVTAANTYYVDYNSKITYTVTPKSGYYVSAMTGVTMGNITSGAVTGTKNNVTANISSVTATLSNNRTVSVRVDSTSDVTTGGSMTIDGTALGFSQPKPLNYGATSTIVITPPDGCYAVVTGNDVNATITTDGKATFDVTLTGQNKNYVVKFINNPKIYMTQPQYGSVYVTDDNENYYFNGDPVGYGTKLTVHVKRDHANATVSNVLVNNSSIGTADGSTFNIYEDSTASAAIAIKSGHEFTEGTEYGLRRIFFTDNSGWGDGQVMVHYSNTNSDTNFSDGNTMAMTFKFTNDASQRVYYADIPFSYKYVNFYKKSATSTYTASALIGTEANAFWHGGGTSPHAINTWQENYSDYSATDRETSIQQGTTVKDEPVTFSYSCDFGDDTLTAKAVSGNAVTVDFNKGVLSITPTENTYTYSLVEVKSNASTTVKYYLIRVENFEIVSFTGLQKIYNSQVFNDIQLDLIVKGGVLNYAAKLFSSSSNISGSFSEMTDITSSGFEENKTLEAYINSFLIQYQINTMSGVNYYKVEANDGANHKASSTLRTLFGTNTYNGTRCVYFYNNSGKNISKYNVRACFNNASDEHFFVTMQKLGNTNYYRAVVPSGYESSVNFYLTNPKTFTNDYADYDGKDDTTEVYYFSVTGVSIPATDNANIVYEAETIGDNGIEGEFTQFDY